MTTSSALPVWRTPGMPALLALTAAGFIGYSALMPVAPLWAVAGGSSEAGAGLVNGVLMLATIITQPTVPTLLRRFGTGPALAAGLILLLGPSLLHLISSDLWWILTLSAVRGLGFGIITVTGSAVVATIVEPARHGAAIGAYGAAVAIPQLLLYAAGPWLATNIGFWLVFTIATVPVLAIGAAPRLARVLAAVEARRSHHAPVESRSTPALNVDTRTLVIGLVPPMIILLGVTLAGGALITFTPQLSSSTVAATVGITLLTATAAFSRWRLGMYADRHGATRFLSPLVILSVIGLLLAGSAIITPGATTMWLLIAGMALVGIAYGGLQNLTLLLSLAAVPREKYNTASAVWNMGFDAGTGLGSVLVGAIAAGFSFSTAIFATAITSLLTLPIAIALRRRAG